MLSPWHWISSVCRQKRVLIILCTFGSSFLAFNYSLLSSSTTLYHQTPVPYTSANILGAAGTGTSGDFSKPQRKNRPGVNERRYESLDLSLERLRDLQNKSPFLSPDILGGRLGENDKAHFLPRSGAKLSNGNVRENYDDEEMVSVPQGNVPTDWGKTNGGLVRQSGGASRRNVIFLSTITEDRDIFTGKFVALLQSNENSSRSKDNDNDSSTAKSDANLLMQGSQQNSIRSKTTPNTIISANKSRNDESSDSVLSSVPLSSSSSPPNHFSMEPPSSSYTSQNPIVKLGDGGGSGTESHSIGFSSGNYNNENDFPSPHSQTSTNSNNIVPPFLIPSCNTPTQLRRVQKRKKNLTVIENFIMGWNRVMCNESITYTTHGDYRYLDNLVPLVERWNGPVSLAIYAPGKDLEETLKSISYLKLCTTPKINEWVTFHLIYDARYARKPMFQSFSKPGDIPWLDDMYKNSKWRNCSEKPSFSKGDYTFRIQNGLLYPINIARNIARSAATTHFVLASDIELYPSINFIPSFMAMLRKFEKEDRERAMSNNYEKLKNKFTAAAAAVIAKLFSGGGGGGSSPTGNDDDERSSENEITREEKHSNNFIPSSSPSSSNPNQERLLSDQQQQLTRVEEKKQRHVFVLPVFEVKKEIVPCQVETKEQLAALLSNKTAVLFHHSICPQCHTFPKYEEWKSSVPSHDNGRRTEKSGGSVNRNCNRNASNGAVSTSNRENNVIYPMRIFHKAKRTFPFQLWEPIFIGTKDEPIYDERLSWEGLRDKMVSGYIMCALDYDFYILDDAFLVHKPGIRRFTHLVTKTVMNQDRLINYKIRAELLKKFGKHDECVL